MNMSTEQNLPHKDAVEAYLGTLRTFLMAPNHGNGAWPAIPSEEFSTGSDFVREMLELKWGADCDGASPIRFSMLDRRLYREVYDVPVAVEKKNESNDETVDRLHQNLRKIAGGIASYGHELSVTQDHLDRLSRAKACAEAAFTIFQVDYAASSQAGVGSGPLASLHLSATDAAAFKPDGLTVRRTSLVIATPGLYDDKDDNFAGFRQKIAGLCGKVVPHYPDITQLGLRFVRQG